MGSPKDANCFDRVWFEEPVEVADITFDYDTYLLTAAKAKAREQWNLFSLKVLTRPAQSDHQGFVIEFDTASDSFRQLGELRKVEYLPHPPVYDAAKGAMGFWP